MTQIPGNNVYSQNSGSSTNNPFITVFETRDPTAYDFNYPVQKRWVNTVNETEYVLLGFTSTPTATLANWALIGTGGISIHTVTGNSGGPVSPDDNNNLDFVGDGSSINIIGNPATNTLTANVILPAQYTVLVSDTSSIGGIVPDSVSGTPLCSSGSLANPAYDRTPVVDAITINNAPVQPTDGTNKAYVDLIASGLNFVNTCYASTTANLNAIYNNGAAGVGATLTNAGTLAAFTTDGTSPALNARILVQFQTDQTQNGVYGLTTIGSGAVAWVLTRTADYDTPAQILQGDIVPVSEGTLYADTLWIQTEVVTAIGTDPINFNQFGANKTLQVNIQTPSVSYNPSSSVVACIVELCGGGGGGGGAEGGVSGQSAGGGGGGGGYSRRSFLYSDLSPSLPIAITIGAGGSGGSAGNNNGAAGGSTDFGGIFSASGGGGGAGSALNPGGITAGGGGGPGGSGVGGNINTRGNYGTNGLIINVSGQGTLLVGGAGGSSYFAGAAPSKVLAGAGQIAGAAATSYGNGGGGGVVDMGSSVAGGNGFDGICIITEYILV